MSAIAITRHAARPCATSFKRLHLLSRHVHRSRVVAVHSMATEEYDLVTIGAGSGGVRASRFASANYKAKVAVVELPFGFVSSDSVGGAGGTCVIRGCVPKKLLVYGSSFVEYFEDAVGFGWDATHPSFSWENLLSNKNKEIERLNSVYKTILKNAGCELVEGRGRLEDKNTVVVDLPDGGQKTLKAKYILIAVGGAAFRLPIPGSELTITSDEALYLQSLPKSIAIVGAGYIAVEFAGIFNGLGSEVHLFYRKPFPLTEFDGECRQQVAENLQKRGVHIHPHSNPVRVEKQEDGRLKFEYKTGDGAVESVVVNEVMMATGRKPKVTNLGLESVGVKINSVGAIEVDEYSKTSVDNIYAVGDVTDRINLTPVALMEGMAFANTVFGGKPTKPDHDFVPSAVFCQPPLASVGFTEEQCVEKYSGTIDVYVSKFRPMRNTLSGRDERTLMKIIVHRESDRVIGVHMVGEEAAEIMQGIGIALKCRATKAQFDSTIGIHPSSAEEFVTMRSVTRSHQGRGTGSPDTPLHDMIPPVAVRAT